LEFPVTIVASPGFISVSLVVMSMPSFQLTGRSLESFSDFITAAQRIGSPLLAWKQSTVKWMLVVAPCNLTSGSLEGTMSNGQDFRHPFYLCSLQFRPQIQSILDGLYGCPISDQLSLIGSPRYCR
jgi:hypothetical protein